MTTKTRNKPATGSVMVLNDCKHLDWCKRNIGTACQGCDRYEQRRGDK